ncbi:MAG: hypothetical protein M0005_09650 [Actinomycetota bacterium]|nr:hypothetical protein [Actinomycetota bacterium]
MGLTEPGGGMDLEMAAAAVLADNKDVRLLLRVLGNSLKEALGDRVQVAHATGSLLHRRSEDVTRITVHLDEDDYEAQLEGGSVRCTVGRSSGGIRIRSEQLPVEQWLTRLLGSLQREAVDNQSARAALQNVIIGGGA